MCVCVCVYVCVGFVPCQHPNVCFKLGLCVSLCILILCFKFNIE